MRYCTIQCNIAPYSAILRHSPDCSRGMPPKKSYDFSFKLRAVELARSIGIRPAARQIGVDERQIREWIKKEATLKKEEHPSKRRRLEGRGRKPNHSQVEEELVHWIVHERELYHRVTRKAVAQRASELVNEQSFKASRGWVDKFLKRHGFVIRERTTTGQRLPPELGEKVGNFVLYCQKQREQLHLHPSDIGNMDETAIWADMPGQSTVEVRGARHVPILTTGHEKSRITVCLAAMADGRKLQPLVVFKGKRMPQELKKVTGVHIALTHNGWMQVNTTVEWIPQSSPCLGQLAVSSDSGSTSNIEEGQNNNGLHTGRLYEAGTAGPLTCPGTSRLRQHTGRGMRGGYRQRGGRMT